MAYRIGIDVGGTFTDFLLTQDGQEKDTYKTLSTPHDLSQGVFQGIEALGNRVGLSTAEFLAQVDLIVHATTVATNAILTGTGSRTALLTTKGLRDALEMRRGRKERIYDNKYPPVPPLVPRRLRLDVDERVDYGGSILRPVPAQEVAEAAGFLKEAKVEAVTVCFLNSYANGENEGRAGEILRGSLPNAYVTLSSQCLPEVRFYDRLCTALLNSYVGPILVRYLSKLVAGLEERGYRGPLLVMKSNGGVASPQWAMFLAAAAAISGPAAGAQAGAAYAELHSFTQCIVADMGGTSFDVSMVRGGSPATVRGGEIARYPLALPMVDLRTVGAGGGSVAWIDSGGLLRVGPQSQGAFPGPACYGFGGDAPTSTDACLLLGYLDPNNFLGGRMGLDSQKAWEAVDKVLARPLGLSTLDTAAGIYQVINVNMAAAIREVSVERGHDPREFPLVVAGGAGPLHAAAIASELGSPLVIVPRDSAVFATVGLLLSRLKHDYVRTCFGTLSSCDKSSLRALAREMEQEGIGTLESEGVPPTAADVSYSADLRYVGQYHEIEVPVGREELQGGDLDALRARFHETHHRLYGFSVPEEDVEMVNLRALCSGPPPPFAFVPVPESDGMEPPLSGYRLAYFQETGIVDTPVYRGDAMGSGQLVRGPAIVEQATTAVVVPEGWVVTCDRYGNFRLERAS